jgi:hypothetical protein
LQQERTKLIVKSIDASSLDPGDVGDNKVHQLISACELPLGMSLTEAFEAAKGLQQVVSGLHQRSELPRLFALEITLEKKQTRVRLCL